MEPADVAGFRVSGLGNLGLGGVIRLPGLYEQGRGSTMKKPHSY